MSSYDTYARTEMLPFIPTDCRMVLDVGCAAGVFGAAVKECFGATVWGIEPNPGAATLAADRLDRVLAENVEHAIDALDDALFDTIVFNDVLEHCSEPERVLIRLKAKLKPGGVVISSIPNIRYFRALQTLVLDKDFPRDPEGIFDRTHLRFFTRKSIERLYAEAGYQILRMQGINPLRSNNLFLLNVLTCGAFADARWLQYATVATPRAPVQAGGSSVPSKT